MNNAVRKVSWEEVQIFVSHVAMKYSDQRFDGVYGLPRGGLVPAVMLSHKMCIPLLAAPTSHSLIVDDICDSGESLLHYMKNSSNEEAAKNRPTVVTMFYKDNKLNIEPDYYLWLKGDDWVVFPWEW